MKRVPAGTGKTTEILSSLSLILPTTVPPVATGPHPAPSLVTRGVIDVGEWEVRGRGNPDTDVKEHRVITIGYI
tara:strand:- start:604 stop:825 length:222 start_codon:yes stop_codon:yes gene_type:complete